MTFLPDEFFIKSMRPTNADPIATLGHLIENERCYVLLIQYCLGRAMTTSRPAPHCSLTIIAAFVAAALLVPASNASAQFGRYSGMRRMSQQQMQYMQQQWKAAQDQEKEKYDAFMKRFDTNKNGKIDGKEKGPAQKYLRQLQMGVDPDKAAKNLGRSSSSSKSKRAKPATTLE